MIRQVRKYSLLAIVGLLSYSSIIGQTNKSNVTSYVNPFIGTGAVDKTSLSGNNYPGATVPFGMIQLSPDTRATPDWDCASGYNYNDKEIYGFSHTHLSGTGVAELFDVLLMPVTDDANITAGNLSDENKGWQSGFSHAKESAKPGYYQVYLERYNINAELTTTTRTGVHRYTYPEGKQKRLIVDMDHSRGKGSWGTRILNAQIKQVDEYTIEGYRIITGWAKLRKVYFRATFSEPITGNLIMNGNTAHSNAKVVNGDNVRAVFDFDSKTNTPLTVKVGISPVSLENAKLNLEEEAANLVFDEIKSKANDVWDHELGKIQVEGTDVQKEIFYTALYHTFIQPNVISDVNGDYMDTDYTARRLEDKKDTYYTTFSLWDTYRAAHPLYTLLQPERTTNFVNSLLRHNDSYGYLPIWQLWGQENYCMIGNHSIPVVVDAILKGTEGIDIDKGYEAVKQSSLISHPNFPVDVWEKYGYMPENIQSQSVSITLEIAYNDWCVAQLAKKLGKDDDYKYFTKRSQYYKNLFNPQSKFFQSKDNKGNWIEPFDPLKYGANGGYPFTEGNAWQYFWYVPHDVNNLIKMVGGDKEFAKKLDTFFTLEETSDHKNDNASGFIGQYAHGNEPSHHVVYLYNYAKQPWKTQKYANRVMTELYNNTSSGYSGNDDCGQMSAWYIFGAMGFYPVNPANGRYDIGSPLLKSATIRLDSGMTFEIKTDKKTDGDIYIQSVTLNGKPYNKSYLLHEDIIKGGTIIFKMGSKPSKWGSNPASLT